jgi:hypothetical protein
MQGRAIGRAIVVYGACILAFGVVLAVSVMSPAHAVSASIEHVNLLALIFASVFLAGAGAADNVSSIFRQTILQTAAPDAMRGRIQGVFTVVVTGGPRIGDLYVGVVTAVAALWWPPLLGGLAIMVVVGLLVRFQRTFRHYDALEPLP